MGQNSCTTSVVTVETALTKVTRVRATTELSLMLQKLQLNYRKTTKGREQTTTELQQNYS